MTYNSHTSHTSHIHHDHPSQVLYCNRDNLTHNPLVFSFSQYSKSWNHPEGVFGHWVVDRHKGIHDLIGTVFHEVRHDLGDCRIDCGQDRGFDVLKRMIFCFSVCFFTHSGRLYDDFLLSRFCKSRVRLTLVVFWRVLLSDVLGNTTTIDPDWLPFFLFFLVHRQLVHRGSSKTKPPTEEVGTDHH
jgi:hypothetical protein